MGVTGRVAQADAVHSQQLSEQKLAKDNLRISCGGLHFQELTEFVERTG